jgi:hypothetical protein
MGDERCFLGRSRRKSCIMGCEEGADSGFGCSVEKLRLYTTSETIQSHSLSTAF